MTLQAGLVYALACVLTTASPVLSSALAEPSQSPLLDDDLFWSPNRRFLAAPGPKDKSTIVFRVGGPRDYFEKVWEMPGWSVSHSVSDDGDYLVKCREEPTRRRRKSEEVMLSIYRRGTLVTAVRLDQIILDQEHLGPPGKAFRWGLCKGFVSLHRFAIETVDRRTLEYDVTTGALVAVYSQPPPLPTPPSGSP